MKICKNCSNEFEPEYRTQKYCAKCKLLSRDLLSGKVFNNARPQRCARCEALFIHSRKRKYCSDECERLAQLERAKEKRQTDEHISTVRQWGNRVCPICKRTFTPNSPVQIYDTRTCVNHSEYRRDQRRGYRARKRNAFVERVSTDYIYLRDKGICQICGEKIDRSIKLPNLKALTLDHIIPLACGGTHEPKNVQLAHFICNSLKNSSALKQGEQLRLY